jgi:hypothetical protein
MSNIEEYLVNLHYIQDFLIKIELPATIYKSI